MSQKAFFNHYIFKGIFGLFALTGAFGGSQAQAASGATCHTDDPNQVCIGLKWVAYKDKSGASVQSEDEAVASLNAINDLWKQCGIAFQIDEYAAVDPTEQKLAFATANNSDLETIRSKYEGDSTLLVVTTGAWDRSGSLGNTGANAWTAMPGSGPYGAIMESEIKDEYNIYAHELGHYLGLDHADDKAQMMNPIIYKSSTQITDAECKLAVETAKSAWPKMLR